MHRDICKILDGEAHILGTIHFHISHKRERYS